jgi:hypothetical protein
MVFSFQTSFSGKHRWNYAGQICAELIANGLKPHRPE